MKRTIGLPLLIILAACGIARASSPPPPPDWVTQAASSPSLPVSWHEARAVFLLEDTLLTVAPDGRATERYRAVVKILRPQGRDYAHPVAAFSKDEKLDSFHVWSIGPDGHQYSMKDSEYVEVGADEEGILYNDERAKVASPPGADPGGIVAWETTFQLPSYLSEDIWNFQHSVPLLRGVYEIDLPPGWHEAPVWFQHASVKASDAGPDRYRWELDHIDGIDLAHVPLPPAWQSLAGRMSVHFGPQPIPAGDALWTKIGNWYTGLAAPQSEGHLDIATQARTLAGDGDFMARLEKVAAFMQQQIRYVGIEIGVGNLQPHPAEDVLQKRYGDCKDKATLMIAMLDAVGIRASWLMVDVHRGVIDPGAPSIYGDHMITAIEIPAGYENPRLQAVVTTRSGRHYLLFDPTNAWVPVGQLPVYLQGGYGLLMNAAESQVIALPVGRPDADTIDRRATLQLSTDGTLQGNITVLRSGALSDGMRHRLAMDSEKQQRETVESLLQHDLSSFTLGTETIAHVRDLNEPLEMDYSVTAPLYGKVAGNLLLVRPRVIGTDADGLDDQTRTVPISFDGVGTWRDDFDLKIPAGYAVDDLPDAVNLDMGFATYHSEVKADGSVLHYRREYVLKQVRLDPAQYDRLRKLEAAIATDETSDVVLKRQ